MYQHISKPQKRIITAILLSMAIIAGALILRGDTATTNTATVVNGEPILVTAAPKRTAIEINDSNNDGVPDWQEALQTTEPVAVSDETVPFLAPDTLTDKFALEFFEQMVRNENYGDFGKSPEEMVNNFSTTLTAQARDTLIERNDVIIGTNNTPETLAAYGEAAARIIINNDEDSDENEAVILERALRDSNAAELAKLDAKINVYQVILKETLQLTAPSSVATEHLLIVNAYQAILADIIAMRNAFDDPMMALLRMKRYQEDVSGLNKAITLLSTKLIKGGATWPKDSVVYQLISFTE
jgi:hypothetical protein